MKLAMVRVDAKLAEQELKARMLLQIHDELIFEVSRAELSDVATIVRTEMKDVAQLSVPLDVTVKVGRNWYDVEETADV